MWGRIAIASLAAFAVSAAGGVWLGNWLGAQAPQSVASLEAQGAGTIGLTDGSQGAQVPEPPQPRMDGTRGTPPRPADIFANAPPLVSVLEDANAEISLSSTVPPAPDELATMFGQGPGVGFPDTPGTSGLPTNAYSDVATVNLDPPAPVAPQPFDPSNGLPLQYAPALPADAPQTPAAPASADWQAALRNGLAACEQQGFFSRPSCRQQVRATYCTPNQAWDRVPECARARGGDSPY